MNMRFRSLSFLLIAITALSAQSQEWKQVYSPLPIIYGDKIEIGNDGTVDIIDTYNAYYYQFDQTTRLTRQIVLPDIELKPYIRSFRSIGNADYCALSLIDTASGLFRSSDRGITWQKVLPLSSTCIVRCANDNSLYLITMNIHTGAYELYTSIDNGLTWNMIAQMKIRDTSISDFYVDQYNRVIMVTYSSQREILIYDMNTQLFLYRAAIQKNTADSYLQQIFHVGKFLYIQYANSYIYLYPDLSMTEGDTSTYRFRKVLYSKKTGMLFAICSTFTDNIAVELYKSADTGKTWSKLSPMLQSHPIMQIDDIAVDSAGMLYLLDPIGLYRSTNEGNTWEFLVPQNTKVTAMDTGPDNNVIIRVESRFIKSYLHTSDNGTRWEDPSYLPRDWHHYLFTKNSDGDNLLFSDDESDITTDVYYSTASSPLSFTKIAKIPNAVSSQTPQNKPVHINDKIFVSIFNVSLYNFSLYVTSDNGFTWSVVNLPISQYAQYKLSADTKGYIRITHTSGVYQSTDEGNSWTTVSGFDVPFFITQVHPVNDTVIFINTNATGCWFTTDIGKTWQSIDRIIFTDMNDAIEVASEVFTATDKGLYIFSLITKTWKFEPIAGQITAAEKLFFGKDNFLYVSLANNGIWIKQIPLHTARDKYSHEGIDIQYIADEHHLRITSPRSLGCSVQVRDILGRKVADFGNMNIEYEKKLSLPFISAGMYIVTLQTSSTTVSRKFVLTSSQ